MRRSHDYCIKSVDALTNEENYYLSATECAKALGCSRQLVYQVLSQSDHFKYFKSAKGHTLEWVKMTGFVTAKH